LNENLNRLENLTSNSQPLWGKMNAAQMLAHVNIAYGIDDGSIPVEKPNFFMKLLLKNVIKKVVTGEKPYAKNSRTAPVFLVSDERIFETEKANLIKNMKKVQQNGASHYEGKVNPSFGKMNSSEWNNMFSKHLDHHFAQFGI
ncbi:MAG: DUF1569 domain-containing protein, partial [Chitinophagaceae bacterium]|nr:DUF1569 domain-containing protein [Chitinophagaceae bacterium]